MRIALFLLLSTTVLAQQPKPAPTKTHDSIHWASIMSLSMVTSLLSMDGILANEVEGC